VKAAWTQPDLDGIPNNPLDKILCGLFFVKESLKPLRERAESRGGLLKAASGLLDEAQAMLSDMRQGELFEDESAGAADDKDDMDCKNEIFEELRI
jgi:hypothetical protein